MALAAAPDVPGFQALSPLGYGPTSTIYSAQSTTLGRWVALTVYSASLPDERSQKKFRRAFDVARRLGIHPAAVTMLDCGLTADRHAYVATEIYERGTLEGRSQGRPVPVDEVLRIGVALAGALETAHRADVTHGGVHPGRVLLGNDGESALADLGLVALVERGGLAALTGPVSLCYHASPEVLEGETVTPASDVFSLASTLYAALAARPPYQRDSDDDTPASLLLRILQHDVPPIGRPDVPPSLEDALRRALSCSPRDRPGRALAFARELQTCQQELGLPATDPAVMQVSAGLELAVADEPGAAAPSSVSVFPDLPAPDLGRPAPPPPAAAPSSPVSVFPDLPAPDLGRPSPPSSASPLPELPAPDLGRPAPPPPAAALGTPEVSPVPPPPAPEPTPAPVPAAASAEPAPAPQVAPSPSSNGSSPVQRVFIPYPAPEPPDPLHRDEQDGAPGPGAPAGLAEPGAGTDPTAGRGPGAVVPLFPGADAPGPSAPDDRPALPKGLTTEPPARPEPLIGLPSFQPDGPPVPFDVGMGGAGAPPAAPPSPAWPEHPGASDPSEQREGGWLHIPVGDENDPAAGAPPWPGPSSNGNGSTAAAAAAAATPGDVEPDGFVWPDDTKALGRSPDPDGLALPDGPRRNGNGLSAGIGAGWPDTPRRNGSPPADPNEWPYVADRPARGAEGEASPAPATTAAPVAPLPEHDRHDAPADSGGWVASAVAAPPAPPASPTLPIERTDDGEEGADAARDVPPGPAEEMGIARALPVIAVGVIVAVLTLGVAWVVMFGEDPGESANQSTTSAPPPDELRGDTGGAEGVMAVENPTGVQLDWGGTEGPQVVVILSDAQPARTLPATTGSALLVPASSLDPNVGYCFAVVPETDPLPTPTALAAGLPADALQSDACVRGATAETVLRR